MAWVEQNGQLRVRQREQLRRALTAASELLSWATLGKEPVDTAVKDAVKLTHVGIVAMAKDLAGELAAKKTEMTQLKKSAKELVKLADKGDFDDAQEYSYSRTVRDSHGMATKIEALTLATADEARDAAASIEKKMETWDKLRTQMLVELKVKQKKLEEVKDSVDVFVDSSRAIIREVFATLY